VTKKLTVNLGMRWEYWPSSTPHFPEGFSNYNPFNNTLELAGLGSVPNDLGIENQKKSFAPRFGVAWRVDEKTVVRGGYGITNPPNQSYTYIPKDLPQGYVQSWNIAVERALPSNFIVEAAYVGNHGVNVPTSNNININASQTPGSGSAGRPENILFWRTADTNRPYNAHSYYDALQAKLNRRFSNGFMLTTAYAYGKAIDFNASTTGGNFNNIIFAANRGRADWDRQHIFSQSYVYELPFGAGKQGGQSGVANWLLGGWQVNGPWTWESGLPLDIAISNATLNAPGNINRPNVNGTVQVYSKIGPGQLYFNTAAFSAPSPNSFGNVGRTCCTARVCLRSTLRFSADSV
jgi:hypothetical protein